MASHMGGAWERLIRSARKCLENLAGRAVLCDERLTTLMCIVEDTINSRPLSYTSTDPSDLKPLTPNDLLRAGQKHSLPICTQLSDRYGKRWKHVQLLGDQFWSRWRKEYIPKPLARHKWHDVKHNLKAMRTVFIRFSD